MTAALAVVCGLAAEAKIARGSDAVDVIAGGGDPRRIRGRLDDLAPAAVLSFGIAGGLSPGLTAGAVRVAACIVAADGRRIDTDRAWSEALGAALGAEIVHFAGVDAPVTTPEDKRRLHAATGAAVVDMESQVAGAWAATHGARFAAVRVVTDSATRGLPHAAAVGMRADGEVDLAAILKSMAKNPSQLPELIRTGLDARAAFAALFRCRQRLGPRFALLDLGEPLLHVT